MNELIGATLKNARKNSRITIVDVHRFLSENDIHVSEKTIYGWENSACYPNVNIFLLLCKFYGIKDILETFGYGE